MLTYSSLVLGGQSAATLLGRLYYEKGGNSMFVAALVQSAGFPVLLPFLLITAKKNPITDLSPSQKLKLAGLYVVFGTFLAIDCLLYSVGLMHLPASTFSLICGSQLGFNAFFSYLFNSQKFTPAVLNSVLLLTLSSVLLVSQPDSLSSSTKKKYVLGIICTISAAAGYALLLLLAQMAYGKIFKRQTITEVLNIIFFESLVTTCALLAGLLASGEWKTLKGEMHDFQLGRTSYVLTSVWTALSWQIFSIGLVALILKVSALFANVVSTLTVPVIPILATIFFRDKMSVLKFVAMILAIWGSASFIYQQYLDRSTAKQDNEKTFTTDGVRN